MVGTALAHPTSWRRDRPWQFASIAIILVAVLIQAFSRTDVDLAWLLTVGEKMMAGQRLYVDVIEFNPPLSVLLYLPAIWLGRWLGAPPELAVIPLVLAGSIASVALSARIVAPLIGDDAARRWKFVSAGLFILLLFPAGVFNQREHIAVIALLPFVCVAATRATGRGPPILLLALAGAGAGVAMSIKPHFALAAGLPLLVNVWTRKSLRPALGIESWIAAAVVVAYGMVVVLAFPHFLTDVLPGDRDAYLAVRKPLLILLTAPAVSAFVILLCVGRLLFGDRGPDIGPTLPFLAASVGGGGSYLIQGKLWPYQAYPMLAFALFFVLAGPQLIGGGESEARWPNLRKWLIGLFALAAVAMAMGWFTVKGAIPDGLRERVARIAPSPRMLAISPDNALGHPLIREVHGVWVGSVSCQMFSAEAVRREAAGPVTPTVRARLESIMADDRRRLADDILAGRPNVILIDERGYDWGRWARSDPRLAAALGSFRPDRSFDGVDVWIRR